MNFAEALPWWLLDTSRPGPEAFIRDLNRLYRKLPRLHARDCEPEGFRWIVVQRRRANRARLSAQRRRRRQADRRRLQLHSSAAPHLSHGLPSPAWREALDSDSTLYALETWVNSRRRICESRPAHGFPASAALTLPPLSTLFLEFDPH